MASTYQWGDSVMRWTTKPIPKKGDIRIVERFALLPKTIGCVTIWLEKYESVEHYEMRRCATRAGTMNVIGWYNTCNRLKD